MKNVSFQPLKPLLQTGSSLLSRLFSYAGLLIGVLLLLCSIQMYINIQQLLGGSSPRKDGYDFISVRKTITNASMGNLDKNLFSETEIEALKKAPHVEDVSPLLANNFRMQFSGGTLIPFVSDFFLESLDDSFIDTVPPGFHWQQGQVELPLIVASDFLEIYNVFAPGYGMPQLSKETVLRMGILVICYAPDGSRQVFQGRIVALSDRVNSFLVPASFLSWANKTFGNDQAVRASRVYVKTKDANNAGFLNYLQQQHYEVNKDKTKFGRAKTVLQGVFSGLAIFGLLVVALALLLFSFYLQLMIARSAPSLQLLLTLGYSPAWLSRRVSGQFIPVFVGVVFVALLLTQVTQWLFHHFAMYNRPELSTPLHWLVLAVALALVIVAILANFSMVKRLLNRLYQ